MGGGGWLSSPLVGSVRVVVAGGLNWFGTSSLHHLSQVCAPFLLLSPLSLFFLLCSVLRHGWFVKGAGPLNKGDQFAYAIYHAHESPHLGVSTGSEGMSVAVE